MKKLILAALALALHTTFYAQISTPQPSPSQRMEQRVGLTDITIDYSRPSTKGRPIFGNLVPFDKLWRTGANNNTTIKFSYDVEIGGKTLKAGTYSIFSKPALSSWDIYFYNDTNNWGLPEKWDESKVAVSVNVPTTHLSREVETFTISIDNITNDSANLGISWSKTYVAVPIKFKTDEVVSAGIQRAMNGPSAEDYYLASVYYFESNKDIQQAKEWIDKAMQLSKNPKYWQLRQKSLIYMKAGDKKGAIEAARQSLELAKQAKNDDYVALNTKSLKEWGAM
ncbi:MAG TPA: DUF2911 domain-containing protein [Flavobacteriaceae bacterium]|nr:DUF2911 domain-containing protein [Flavobacteriaceae bacterium]